MANEEKGKGMKEYTVVGFYVDSDQPVTSWVEAESPRAAAAEAVKDIMQMNEWLTADNVRIVEVYEGHLTGALCSDSIVNGEDVV